MKSDHEIIETILTIVCSHYKVDWKQAINMEQYKLTPELKNARFLSFYLLVYHTSKEYLTDIFDISAHSLGFMEREIRYSIGLDEEMQDIRHIVNRKIRIIKQQNEINFQPCKSHSLYLL